VAPSEEARLVGLDELEAVLRDAYEVRSGSMLGVVAEAVDMGEQGRVIEDVLVERLALDRVGEGSGDSAGKLFRYFSLGTLGARVDSMVGRMTEKQRICLAMGRY
jgi:hypothetical protein